MKRLQETELDARIHKFMGRKLAEFPELKTDGTKPNHSPETSAKAAPFLRLNAKAL